MVFIVVGTGIFFSIVFHVGVKEHPRDCSAEFATKSSKRSAGNWTAWFREPLFYQVWVSSLPLGTSNVRCLCTKWSIDLIMVLEAIFTRVGNSRQKLQCLYGYLMANMNSELL